MGTFASVLVYPREPRKPTLFGRIFRGEKAEDLPARPEETCDLDGTARRILRCFEGHGFTRPGVAENAAHVDESTFGTCRILEESKLPVGLEWRHLTVAACDLRPAISEIVWTQTVGQWYEGLKIPDGENPEALFVPYLDVMVFSREVEIYDAVRDKVVCNPWAVIEFSFEDCRLSEEIHQIRNFDHALFRELASIFGRDPAWDYRAA